ncbi:hypothetical protein L7F22_067722 [Adiantum nelumboides]|nr:hypothetical protein [Adiantum nelumboides]
MLPYLSSSQYEGFLAQASPSLAFMLANAIVLAILLTSHRSPKPGAGGKRPTFSLIRPNRRKSPKLHPAQQQLAGAAKPKSYGSHHILANPNETLILSAFHPIELLHSTKKHNGAETLPDRDEASCECNGGDGDVPLAEAIPSADKALTVDVGQEDGSREEAFGEAVQTCSSNEDLDRRFDEFITTFFARVRAEIRESRV